jgi:putative selenate reductase
VLDALAFLDQVKAGAALDLGRRVLVVGGGNSAMDAARTARRLVPEGEVTLVYRRTRAQMPADPGEVSDCLEEGIGLRDLLAPASVLAVDGKLAALCCTPMRLGERDASGRPRPVPVAGAEERLPADTLIVAISQEPELDFLAGLDLRRRPDGTLDVDPATRETSVAGLFAGGDVVHGAASVIKAIADGRAVAETIARRHGVAVPDEPFLDKGLAAAALLGRKASVTKGQQVPVLPLADRGGFSEVIQTFTPEAAALEASRCLACDDLCSLCVTVCPNRANHAYAVVPFSLDLPVLVQRQGRLAAEGTRTFALTQRVQTLNVADACNECGNCATFCPTAGAPYRDKPRFWLTRAGFEAALGDAFHLGRGPGGPRLEAKLKGRAYALELEGERASYQDGRVTAQLTAGTWALESWTGTATLEEGTPVDLAPCATLIALLNAATVLPRS